MIEVGDSVICVNDSEPEQSDAPFVIKGRVYTVVRMKMQWWPVAQFGPVTIMKPEMMIWVEGLPSQTGHFGFRFRKIEKKSEQKKTSIEVFTRMLDKQPERVK